MLLYFLSSKDMIFLILHKKKRKVYYSRAHIDTFKGERENADPLYYTYKDIHEKYNTDRLFAQIIGRISALTILQYINYKNDKLIGRIKYALT